MHMIRHIHEYIVQEVYSVGIIYFVSSRLDFFFGLSCLRNFSQLYFLVRITRALVRVVIVLAIGFCVVRLAACSVTSSDIIYRTYSRRIRTRPVRVSSLFPGDYIEHPNLAEKAVKIYLK